MKISNIHSNLSYKGRVLYDRTRAKYQIGKCPSATRESILGNMDSLEERLRKQTPDSETFKITFEEQDEKESVYDPKYYYGIVKVVNNKGGEITNRFLIGHSGGSAKEVRTVLSGGEKIWLDGFKDITQSAIENNFCNQDKSLQSASTHLSAQRYEELVDIYSKLQGGAKTIMNKADVAKAILNATINCPDEIKDSIISNINSLTERLDEETTDSFRYLFKVKKESEEPHRDLFGKCYEGHTGLNIQITKVNTHQYAMEPEYFEKLILFHQFNDTEKIYNITTSIIPKNEKPYCPLESEEIYEEIFKPMTEKLLSNV